MSRKPHVCLTIAGLDPSGGAGIVADIKTFSAFGCFAASVVTSVTFQNTTAVFGAVHQSANSVRRQAEAVFDDFEVSAVKTGMLPTASIIKEVGRMLRERDVRTLVVDPVVRSTSGFDLIDDRALAALIENLFPLATVVTPNMPETERIAKRRVRSEKQIEKAANEMLALGAANVLIKGGHVAGAAARDHLFSPGGHREFTAPYYDTTATHGTGCTLAAAVAANLARGKTLEASVESAKRFVNEAIRTAPGLGRGNSPINIPNKAGK